MFLSLKLIKIAAVFPSSHGSRRTFWIYFALSAGSCILAMKSYTSGINFLFRVFAMPRTSTFSRSEYCSRLENQLEAVQCPMFSLSGFLPVSRAFFYFWQRSTLCPGLRKKLVEFRRKQHKRTLYLPTTLFWGFSVSIMTSCFPEYFAVVFSIPNIFLRALINF